MARTLSPGTATLNVGQGSGLKRPRSGPPMRSVKPQIEAIYGPGGIPVPGEGGPVQTFKDRVITPIKEGATGPLGFISGFGKEAIKRVASVPQNVAKVTGAISEIGTQNDFTKAKENINKINEQLMAKIKSLPENSPERGKFRRLLADNVKTFNQLLEQEKEVMGNIKDTTESFTQTPSVLEAKTTAEKAGGVAERIAEFMLAGKGIATPAEEALTGIASKVPALTTGAPAVAAKVTAGAAAEGLGAATAAAAQTGSIKESAKAGAFAALFSVPFKLFSALREPAAGALEESAKASASKALAPTTKQNKELTEKVVPELLKRKVVFGTRGGLYEKATAQADDFGQQIDDAFKALPDDAKDAAAPIMKRLEDAKNSLVVKGTNTVPEAAMPQYQALQKIQKEIIDLGGSDVSDTYAQIGTTADNWLKSHRQALKDLNIGKEELPGFIKSASDNMIAQFNYYRDEALKAGTKSGAEKASVFNTVSERVAALDPADFPDYASYEKAVSEQFDDLFPISTHSLRSFRQIVDKAIAKAGKGFGLTGDESAKLAAQKEATNAIRETLASDYPDIARLNREFNFWMNVKKVVGDTIRRTKGQQTPLGETIFEAAGAAGGLARGGNVGDIVLTATGMKLLISAIRSPAWRQASAVVKQTLAENIANGNGQKVAEILNNLVTSGVGATITNTVE